MSHTVQKIRALLSEKNISFALLTSQPNIFWSTGFTGSFAQLLISQEHAIFITDSRYAIQANEQVTGFDVRWFASPVTGQQFLQQIMSEVGVSQLGFESNSVSFGTFKSWEKALSSVEWIPLEQSLDELRMIKTPEEISKIRRACELTDVAFDHILRMVQPGVTEYEIQLDLEFFIRRNGAKMAFEPIIVSGVNSARPHGKATEKPLELGDFITFDFGAELDGYCADMTRTVVVGKASDRTKEVYNQVLKAQLASMEMMKPGVVCEDVDAKAREVFDEIGLAKYFGHGLGHGLGVLVHDPGRLGKGSKTVLQPGHVFTVEPGVYIEGFGGCRIEDDVVITDTGIDILNRSTKELLELP